MEDDVINTSPGIYVIINTWWCVGDRQQVDIFGCHPDVRKKCAQEIGLPCNTKLLYLTLQYTPIYAILEWDVLFLHLWGELLESNGKFSLFASMLLVVDLNPIGRS